MLHPEWLENDMSSLIQRNNERLTEGHDHLAMGKATKPKGWKNKNGDGRGSFIGGHADWDHPRRCTKMRRDGTRCRRWRLKGPRSTKCSFHSANGNRGQLSWAGEHAVFYSKFLGGKLKDKLEKWAEENDKKLNGLKDEIAIARGLLVEALELAQPILDPDHAEAEKVSVQTRVLAMQAINGRISAIKELELAQSKIESAADGNLPLAQLHIVVSQVTGVIYKTLGDEHPDLARRIGKSLEDMRLPQLPGATNDTPGEVTITCGDEHEA